MKIFLITILTILVFTAGNLNAQNVNLGTKIGLN
jgi:hypothetical protein